MTSETGLTERLRSSLTGGLKAGLKTTWYLTRIMVPVSLAVMVLDWTGMLALVSEWLSPALGLIGLPGSAAVAIVSAFFLNIYSGIAAMNTLALDMRQVTILAIMVLTAHNMIVETAVMKKSGSSAIKMIVLRLAAAIALGWLFNAILPREGWGAFSAGGETAVGMDFMTALGAWALKTILLLAKVAALVVIVMVLQRVLDEFGMLRLMSRIFAPFMKLLGLPTDASFLWVVINTAGYAYGAAVIIAQIEDGKMKAQDGDLLNHHACMCHSLVEDTALFAALNVPFFWITVPRLLAAILLVWLENLRRYLFKRSLRAGIA